jgi:hypothetical protein
MADVLSVFTTLPLIDLNKLVSGSHGRRSSAAAALRRGAARRRLNWIS